MIPTDALRPVTRSLPLLYPLQPVGERKPNFGGIGGPLSHIGEISALCFSARGFCVPPVRIEEMRHGNYNRASEWRKSARIAGRLCDDVRNFWLTEASCPAVWLRHISADGGCAADKLRTALTTIGKWTIEIIKHSEYGGDCEILPRRWVVECTFAWAGRNRRLAMDFDRTINAPPRGSISSPSSSPPLKNRKRV